MLLITLKYVMHPHDTLLGPRMPYMYKPRRPRWGRLQTGWVNSENETC